jgi:hypothetical protein
MLVLAGCASSGLLENGVFHKGGLSVHIGPVPPGWVRIRLPGADVAYRDETTSAMVMLDVQCGREADAPLTILTEHLIMGTTDRAFSAQDVIPFDAREALHSLLQAKLDGVVMRYDIYVVKKDGCVTDIVYVAPPQDFPVGAADFERFALGLHARSTAPGNVASDP